MHLPQLPSSNCGFRYHMSDLRALNAGQADQDVSVHYCRDVDRLLSHH